MTLQVTDPLHYDFPTALTDALQRRACSTAQAGRYADVSASMISHWSTGRNTPAPSQVFALEKGMKLKPGELSRHLGYLPLEAAGAVIRCSVSEAVRTDDDLALDPQLADALLEIYRRFVAMARGSGR